MCCVKETFPCSQPTYNIPGCVCNYSQLLLLLAVEKMLQQYILAHGECAICVAGEVADCFLFLTIGILVGLFLPQQSNNEKEKCTSCDLFL